MKCKTQTLYDCEITYACDPEKNTQCKKTSCKFNSVATYQDCESVQHREFAKLDKHGEPRINFIRYKGTTYIRFGMKDTIPTGDEQ